MFWGVTGHTNHDAVRLMSASIAIEIEGTGPDGRLKLGDPASLVIEGKLPPRMKPEKCDIYVTVTSAIPKSKDEVSEASFSLSVADFMSGPGPFLCQIDFEAESVGGMTFQVDLLNGDRLLAQAATSLRVVNPLRDTSGKARKSGAGALKVKK
jgi:hypothetical protein